MQITVHIDKSGRIVIPKEMRDELGLMPDQPLAIEQTPEGLLLKSRTTGVMIERDGIWSYRPQFASPYDPVEILRATRETR